MNTTLKDNGETQSMEVNLFNPKSLIQLMLLLRPDVEDEDDDDDDDDEDDEDEDEDEEEEAVVFGRFLGRDGGVKPKFTSIVTLTIMLLFPLFLRVGGN
jgi:hypothetical protein